ncbi:MAG: hypothetical protein ABIF77_17325 [bacterium]
MAEKPQPGGESWFIQITAFLAAVLGHLPALGAFWNQDDWGLLSRAAGLLPAPELPVRFLSQQLYWQILYPLFGLEPDPYTWTRLLLHGGCAVLVARIAARGGLGSIGQLVASLLFAASPLVFTPLYWASGVQELLGAFLALAALDRWLAGGRRNLLLALVMGGCSVLAKENGLGLPLLLAMILWRRRGVTAGERPLAWLVVSALTAITIGECILVWRHFDTGIGTPYAVGSWFTPLGNLGMYGWWLLTPGPVFTAAFSPVMGFSGWALWLVWTAWSWLSWRRGNGWPAACLCAALLSLAPCLVLVTHWYPYLALLAAAAGALTIGQLVPRHWPFHPVTALFLVVAAVSWSWIGMETRLKQRDDSGLPADPLVLRTAVSYQAVQNLKTLPAYPGGSVAPVIFLFQPPPSGPAAEYAETLGENWIAGTLLYNALDGLKGPRLVLPPELTVRWRNSLDTATETDFVLVDAGHGFRPWGQLPQALLYLSLHEVAWGRFESAQRHLLRAASLSDDTMPFFYDRDLMLVTLRSLQANATPFQEFLADDSQPDPNGVLAQRRAALLEIFSELLVVCSEGIIR